MNTPNNYLLPKLFSAIIVFSTLITSCNQNLNLEGIPNSPEIPGFPKVPQVPKVPCIIKIKPNDQSKYLKEIINPNTTPFKFSQSFSSNNGGYYYGGNWYSGDINISVAPNSIKLEDGSKAPDGNYKIAVKEYFTVSDMLKAGISTMSNGKLLVTAGCFYWEIHDENGNNNYKVDDANLNFKISKLYSKEYINNMQLFKGEITGKETNVVNWVNPNKVILRSCEPREVAVRGFSVNGCKSFDSTIGTGYHNTDAFLGIEADKRTQFKVILSAKSAHKITASKVIIKAMDYDTGAYLFFRDDYFSPYDNSIPVGMKLHIIAMGENDEGKFFIKEQKVTIAGDDVFEMELETSSKEEILAALK